MQRVTYPQDLMVRPAGVADLPAIVELVRFCEAEFDGQAETTLESMQALWSRSDFDPETETWAVSESTGKLVAYARIEHRKHAILFFHCYVSPSYRWQGIEEHLLEHSEQRAQAYIREADPEVRVSLIAGCSDHDHDSMAFFEHQGFLHVRSFWRMNIELHEAPPQAQWAEGLHVQRMQPGMERAVYEADEEIFRDHWGHLPATYEEWSNHSLPQPGVDSSFWFLAMAGDEIAGIALCKDGKENGGWVRVLGVRRPWRRNKVGLSLLHHAFEEFYRRGIKQVYLSVDALSLTDATHLYTRAGMHVDRQIHRYEKELRAGKELRILTLNV
ncbi:GNAT family N-acetyltransferase [Tengunoibacter tsumagoiensis]|uniref:Putative acetyltransferase, GNAT n=1 Tax=Tengunoibacter tsumagoiensis TaxID=2014871 RepID=A0A401ZYA7_9CHLR|nr:GNAT family N-acetyltransferase [Tengunoibacter tsumagoiensis]GCE11844.1 putative acetyltransferase, GNAT [Tengunoibacter tsumagoiensis]